MRIFYVIVLLHYFLFAYDLAAIKILQEMKSPLSKEMATAKNRHLELLEIFLSVYGGSQDIVAFHELKIDLDDFQKMMQVYHTELETIILSKNHPMKRAADRLNFTLDKDLPYISFFLMNALFKTNDYLVLFGQFYDEIDKVEAYFKQYGLQNYQIVLQDLLKIMSTGRNEFQRSLGLDSNASQRWAENLAIFLTYQSGYSFEKFVIDAQNNYFIKNTIWGPIDVPQKNMFNRFSKPLLVSEYHPVFQFEKINKAIEQAELAIIIGSLRILRAPQGGKSFSNFNEQQLRAFYTGLSEAGFSEDPLDLKYNDSNLNMELPLKNMRVLYGFSYLGPNFEYAPIRQETIKVFSAPLLIRKYLKFTNVPLFSHEALKNGALLMLREDILWQHFKKIQKNEKKFKALINEYSGCNRSTDLAMLERFAERRDDEQVPLEPKKIEKDDDTRVLEEHQKKMRPQSKKALAKEQQRRQKANNKKKKRTEKPADIAKQQKVGKKNSAKKPVPGKKPPQKTTSRNKVAKQSKPANIPLQTSTPLTQNDGIPLVPMEIDSDESIRERVAEENRLQLIKQRRQFSVIAREETNKEDIKKSKKTSSFSFDIFKHVRNAFTNPIKLQKRLWEEGGANITKLQEQAYDLEKKRHLGLTEKQKLLEASVVAKIDCDLSLFEQKLLGDNQELLYFPKAAESFHYSVIEFHHLTNLLLPFYPTEVLQEINVYDAIVGQQNVVIADYNKYLWAKDQFVHGICASTVRHKRLASMLLKPEEKFTAAEIQEIHDLPERMDQDIFSKFFANFVTSYKLTWASNFQFLTDSIHRLLALQQMFIHCSTSAKDEEECEGDFEESLNF